MPRPTEAPREAKSLPYGGAGSHRDDEHRGRLLSWEERPVRASQGGSCPPRSSGCRLREWSRPSETCSPWSSRQDAGHPPVQTHQGVPRCSSSSCPRPSLEGAGSVVLLRAADPSGGAGQSTTLRTHGHASGRHPGGQGYPSPPQELISHSARVSENLFEAQRVGGHSPPFRAGARSMSSATRAPFTGAQQFSRRKL